MGLKVNNENKETLTGLFDKFASLPDDVKDDLKKTDPKKHKNNPDKKQQ
ncbi:SPJ_0845 family protein [Lactobacillus selangorensis]|nr:SPJ_0845 family protein [Lactobacillus selangorensis]